MLAADDHVLEIDGEALQLRPSLRAAVRLERRFGGFQGLLQAIGEGSIAALVAVAVECGEAPNQALILAPSAETWAIRFERITPALVRLVFDLAEIDSDAPGKPRITLAKPVATITLAEAYAQLFGVATGVLGWTPAAAWAATPAEIKTALDAHLSAWFDWEVPVGGMFVWATARDLTLDTDALLPHALADPKPLFDDAPLDSAGLAELAAMH